MTGLPGLGSSLSSLNRRCSSQALTATTSSSWPWLSVDQKPNRKSQYVGPYSATRPSTSGSATGQRHRARGVAAVIDASSAESEACATVNAARLGTSSAQLLLGLGAGRPLPARPEFGVAAQVFDPG